MIGGAQGLDQLRGTGSDRAQQGVDDTGAVLLPEGVYRSIGPLVLFVTLIGFSSAMCYSYD
jgi:hypothetical protein